MHHSPNHLATLLDGLAITAMALISAAVVACGILASLGAFTS
jgi:hypothetical protein